MQKLAQTHCHTHTNRALSHSLHMDSFWRKQTCQHPSQRFSATLMPTAGIPLSLPARQTQTQMWGGTQHYFCYAGSYFTETSFLGVNGWKFPHKTFIFDQNCLINTVWTEINCLLPSLTHLLSHCTVLTINSTKPLFLLKHWASDSLFSDKQVFIVDWVTFCIARSSAEKPPSKHSINLRVTFTLKKGIQVMIK